MTVVANYADWDGVSPAATNFEVIVLLDGKNCGSTLQSAAATAIKAYVTNASGADFASRTQVTKAPAGRRQKPPSFAVRRAVSGKPAKITGRAAFRTDI
jgi:hypothetical protein